MSYCRFSSMNNMCDVYVYENVCGEWTIHVASCRNALPPIPEIPINRLPSFGAAFNAIGAPPTYPSLLHKIAGRIMNKIWSLSHRLHLWSCHTMPKKNIGLDFDGETLNCSSAEECRATLVMLQTLGYKVPQYAIDSLLEESNPCND